MFISIVPVIVFVSIAWMIERIVNRRALNRERLKLIEKGGDLKDLKVQKENYLKINGLKYGLVVVGLSIGSLVGSFLNQNKVLANDTVGYIFAISFFVGIALILSHYLTQKDGKDKL